MNEPPESLADLKANYRQLRQRLGRTGYISQGMVQQRSAAAAGRIRHPFRPAHFVWSVFRGFTGILQLNSSCVAADYVNISQHLLPLPGWHARQAGVFEPAV